jgi:hypothetical protein
MKEITRYGCEYCTQVFEDKDSCLNHEDFCDYNRDKFTRVSGALWTITFALATGEYEEPSSYHHDLYRDSEGNYYHNRCGQLILMDCALDVPEVAPDQYGKHKLYMYTLSKGTTSVNKKLVAYLNKWAKERAQNIVDKGMIKCSAFCREV